MKTYDKKWFIILGQNTNNYFDTNITKDNQYSLVKKLKSMKWDKVYHNQEKYYHYEDMKYIIDNRNKHSCFKTKILSYERQNNVLMGQFTMVYLPIDKFPPITEYHDMMICEHSTFIKDAVQIHVKIVNHGDNIVSYEIRIESNNKEEAIDYANKLDYNIEEFKPKYIDHGSYYILSLI